MLFHMSIGAEDPGRVARFFAALWQGEAFPWGSAGWWMAMAADDRNTAVEIYPRGTVLSPNKDQRGDPWAAGYTATHAAIATPLSQDEVIALAAREGWLARPLRRGDEFGVIEVWLENVTMLEVMPPEMVAEYLETQTVERWRAKAARAQPA